MGRVVIGSAIALALGLGAEAVQPAFEPAVYRAGGVPLLPTMAVGGGEVLFDVAVNARGNVDQVTPLRLTPPFSELFADAVRGWTFRPAKDLGLPAPAHVLVAVLVRPPALTIPSTLGEQPRDVAPARPELPFPLSLVVPPHPPNAHRSGVVLVEARIDVRGHVTAAQVVRPAPPFNSAASDAAWQWTFTPARLRGTPIPSVAYLAFGFPEPVTGGGS